MSKIHDAVVELHGLPGVKGAAVITHDGLVVASSLDEGFTDDVIGGLTSYLLMTTQRSLREGGVGRASQYLLTATHGKTIIVDIDESSLVVLLDQFAELGTTRREVQEAAQRIRRASRIA